MASIRKYQNIMLRYLVCGILLWTATDLYRKTFIKFQIDRLCYSGFVNNIDK